MSDTVKRNFISIREASELAKVSEMTIRRFCKKLAKSPKEEYRNLAKKEFELNSTRYNWLIDRDFVETKWLKMGSIDDVHSDVTTEEQKKQEPVSSSEKYLDRAISLMETTVKTLEQQNRQLIDQNNELKEQNKQFYQLLSEMNKRGFFLDAPKPAGATTNGQAVEVEDLQQKKEEKPKKKGFFSRLFS